MIEGLWVVRFLGEGDPRMELNGGVVVIETGKVYGGDSGYYYVGTLAEKGDQRWGMTLTVQRHDPQIESVFGDLDTINLHGDLSIGDLDSYSRPTMLVSLAELDGLGAMSALLTRVADLP